MKRVWGFWLQWERKGGGKKENKIRRDSLLLFICRRAVSDKRGQQKWDYRKNIMLMKKFVNHILFLSNIRLL